MRHVVRILFVSAGFLLLGLGYYTNMDTRWSIGSDSVPDVVVVHFEMGFPQWLVHNQIQSDYTIEQIDRAGLPEWRSLKAAWQIVPGRLITATAVSILSALLAYALVIAALRVERVTPDPGVAAKVYAIALIPAILVGGGASDDPWWSFIFLAGAVVPWFMLRGIYALKSYVHSLVIVSATFACLCWSTAIIDVFRTEHSLGGNVSIDASDLIQAAGVVSFWSIVGIVTAGIARFRHQRSRQTTVEI